MNNHPAPFKAGASVQVTNGRLKGKTGVIQQLGDSMIFVRVGSTRYWLAPSQLKLVS